MDIRRFLICGVLLGVFVSGCAQKQGLNTDLVVTGLSGYVANEKPVLWQDAAGCHLVIKFADGQTLAPRVSATLCENGGIWTRSAAQATQAAQAAAAAQQPKP